MFRLTTDVMENTGREERIETSIMRIVSFLRRRVPGLADTQDLAMREFVQQNSAIARSYEITSEQGLARFCLVQVALNGEAQNVPEIHRLLSRPEGDSELDLRNLIDGLAEASSGKVA